MENQKHTILQLVAESNRKIQELRKEVKAGGMKAIEEVAEQIFAKHAGLKKFVIWGYTPSFNDGEPCTHTSNFGFGACQVKQTYDRKGFYLSVDDAAETFDEFFEFDDEQETYQYGQTPKDYVVRYVNQGVLPASYQSVNDDLSELTDVLNILLETNYQVKVSLNEDGTITVDQDYYDCGY